MATEGDKPALEWELIRRNWAVIITFGLGIGFAIEQWDRVNDLETRIANMEKIVSTEGIVAYEKWRTKVDLTLENYCK